MDTMRPVDVVLESSSDSEQNVCLVRCICRHFPIGVSYRPPRVDSMVRRS